MERYKLEIVNNDGDRYVRGEPAPDGSWMMFKDVEARIAELEAALASARREGMEEAAKKADAIADRNRMELPQKWKDRPGGIPKDWTDSWDACAETAEDIAAAIRAAALEGGKE